MEHGSPTPKDAKKPGPETGPVLERDIQHPVFERDLNRAIDSGRYDGAHRCSICGSSYGTADDAKVCFSECSRATPSGNALPPDKTPRVKPGRPPESNGKHHPHSKHRRGAP